MEPRDIIQVGLSREENFLVEDEQTAIHLGSGASRVLATPWMIAFMERTAHRLLAEQLPEGYSTVGVLVNVRHLAPTPVGSGVRVRVQVRSVEGQRVILDVEAWDSQELVGAGEHHRYVIDETRFLNRVHQKSAGGGDDQGPV